jgi:hypothetical protein
LVLDEDMVTVSGVAVCVCMWEWLV